MIFAFIANFDIGYSNHQKLKLIAHILRLKWLPVMGFSVFFFFFFLTLNRIWQFTIKCIKCINILTKSKQILLRMQIFCWHFTFQIEKNKSKIVRWHLFVFIAYFTKCYWSKKKKNPTTKREWSVSLLFSIPFSTHCICIPSMEIMLDLVLGEFLLVKYLFSFYQCHFRFLSQQYLRFFFITKKFTSFC